jgi:hypothetical protein
MRQIPWGYWTSRVRTLYESHMISRIVVTLVLLAIFAMETPHPATGHDAVTTTITWNREISRIVNARCASCHHEGGRAFSLTTYGDARPWAVAIKEEVLSRRMPPWGAVRGFQEFRNDQSLTAEQLEMISSWVEGGVPEGDPRDLPLELPAPPVWTAGAAVAGAVTVTGEVTLNRRIKLDGIVPLNIPPGASFQLVAEAPGRGVIPLLWLYEYQPAFPHSFLFKTPVDLPAKTKLYGLPAGVAIRLLPAR